MTERIVVTGASGYLGSYLLRSAARRGCPTQGVVRAPVPWIERDSQRIAQLLPEAEAAIEGADVVVHLAAPNETTFRTNSEDALQETVAMSRSVARACAKVAVRRLLYVSTVHVYGSALRAGARVTEDTVPSPVGDYGRSRLISERVLLEEAPGVQVVILRLTNGVGCPVSPLVARWTLVANDLCRQVAETGRMKLAQPSQWRDFIPLDAVVELILEASQRAHQDQFPAGVYNLAAGRSITVLGLAELIALEAQNLGIPASVEAPTGADSPPYQIDNRKIRSTGLLPADLSLSNAVRDTLRLCVAAVRGSQDRAPLGSELGKGLIS